MKTKWTRGKCQEEALKYDTRSDFAEGHPSAHRAAVHYKWLNDICSHMVRRKYFKLIYVTKEICREEALKYATRTDFKFYSSGIYEISRKNYWTYD